jgi:hypothetical protein
MGGDVAKALGSVYGPGESFTTYLQRVGWLGSDGEHIALTALGAIVLRELDQREVQSDVPLQVVLNAEDPLAYARVVERYATHGEALLVDAYFRLDDLMYILNQTQVTRLLTGTKPRKEGRARVAGLATAISRQKIGRPFAMRTTDEIHDRFFIPTTGPVESVGTSLSGVGKRFSMMVTIEPPVADAIRTGMEGVWDRADVVEIPELPPEASSAEVTQRVDALVRLGAPAPAKTSRPRRRQAAKMASPRKAATPGRKPT